MTFPFYCRACGDGVATLEYRFAGVVCAACYAELKHGTLAPPSSPGVGRDHPVRNDVPGRVEGAVRSLEDCQ